ncbi:ABC transporter permease [Azospirillaceae bacterium]
MSGAFTVFRRELSSYFSTPVAYIFIIIFLFLSGIFTFYIGNLFERGQADLRPFFLFHPWLYLLLIPAIAMRMWAEERKSGTIELLLTLPISLPAIAVGKFLAAWFFTIIVVSLTFPIWLTVSWLGRPDHGVIVAGYIGSFLMAGGYLAICSCLSAATKNQVIAFVIGVMVCFLFTVSGTPIVLETFASWAPSIVVDTVASFSFITRFNAITEGVIDIRDVVYFTSLIAIWLLASILVIDLKKAK